jgi:peptidoglycan/LPS O-acetylase OafA/YrhL
VLESGPFWFLGKVSYTLYLFHLIVVKWGVLELQAFFVDKGHDYDLACLYCFLIFTPVLMLASWGLEVAIDTPSKLFAHAVD